MITTMEATKLTQHQRILLKAREGWMCQDSFWHCPVSSKSPHKRRSDIEEGKFRELDGTLGTKGIYVWQERPCIHGISGSKDYLLTRTGRLF